MSTFENEYVKLDEKLNHLTDQQIEELIHKYNSGENISKLIKIYNINISKTNLVKILPPLIHYDKFCKYCSSSLIEKRKPRTGCYSSRDKYLTCPNCNHSEDNPFCACEKCKIERENKLLLEQKRKELKKLAQKELIQQVYNLDQYRPLEYTELTIEDKVYLGALLRGGISENFAYINPVNQFSQRLASTKTLESEIIKHLTSRDLIKVHPLSPIEAFEENENFPYTYYIFHVYYKLNLTSTIDEKELINSIINLEINVNEYKEQLNELWRKVALSECEDYLLYNMEKVGFPYSIGDKTKSVLNDLLNNFSTSQIYQIVYNSVSNATRFYQERKIHKKHAANSVVGSCQRYGEKALSNNWDLKGFRRDFNCPQSLVSEFLYNRVLKIAEEGFYQKPLIS